MNKFVSKSFKEDLYNKVISGMYPSLLVNDKLILLNYLEKTIDFIAYSFRFMKKKEEFEKQLSLKNYQDAKGILNLILIFVNDNEKVNLRSLSQLYTEKRENIDINKEAPKYVYSNIEYGRCLRTSNISEIEFDIKHLENNYVLLLETIKTIHNKLYINWLNIVPMSLNDDYFKQSKKWFDEGELSEINVIDYHNSDNNDKYVKDFSHIQIDDIYNVLTNDYYYTIKNFKWLIYEIKYRGNYYPLIFFIYIMFPFIIDKNFDINYYYSNKDNIDNIFKDMYNCVISGKEFTIYDITLEADQIKKIFIAMIIFFNNHYNDINSLIDRGNYVKINEIENDEDDNIYDTKLDFKKINNSWKSLKKYEHIILFIIDQYNEFYLNPISIEIDNCIRSFMDFNGTKYENIFDAYDKYPENYNILKKNSNKQIIYENIIKKNYNFGYVREKNIYNFCKSLCHKTVGDKFMDLPKFWKSLNSNQKEEIYNRLSIKNNKNSEWFNISGYLIKLRGINKKYKNDLINDIATNIKKNIIVFVLTSLYFKGVLSKFEFNLDVDINSENKEIKNKNNKLLKDFFNKNEDNFSKAYYYLTNKKYSDMTIFHADADKEEIILDRYDKKLYENITYLQSATALYRLPYAMDWISQINFFHKYLNNRIIYVTGSTGVGKSTEVPKLFLYALKAIDHKNNGYAVCTQPRQAPVKKNAETMAKSLGVPIFKNKKEIEKEIEKESGKLDKSIKEEIEKLASENKKFNINIQNQNVLFKHKGQTNIEREKKIGLKLKLVTDALLDMDLTSSILLKDTYKKEDMYRFTKNNKYDIIMVDEAHEHNTNMDLILTIAKYAIMFNNDIKLVIISATMDDDEPVYRRFYRDINDNLMYPLSNFIKENSLDRINVDRRLHISPPGQTTNFRIDEEYYPDEKDKDKFVVDIAKKTDGDMLYFRSGLGEIKQSVEYLNKYLPDDMIAIPYYSQLKPLEKELVPDIGKRKKEIKMNRNEEFNYVDFTKGNNSYNRVVIVSTNIAEASITIDTLKVVIETGTQKTNIYNFEKRVSILKEDNISESSRLQRKGRVGRVGSGKVYYTYKKGTMEKNKIRFGISRENISDALYAKLYGNKKDISKPLLYNDNDPNNQKILWNKIDDIYRDDIKDIIKEQYFLNEEFFGYYGNNDYYDYENRSSIYPYYEDGFDLETLNDADGKFYIIHPEELFLNRNITGKIISVDKTDEAIIKNDKLISYKINSFWDIKYDSLDLIKINENTWD